MCPEKYKEIFNLNLLVIAVYSYIVIFSVSNISLGLVHTDYDGKRVLELFLIILILFNYFLKPYRFYATKEVEIALIIILVLGVISSLLAPYPRYAFKEFSLFIGLVFFVFFINDNWRLHQLKVMGFILVVLAVSAFIYIFSFISGFFASFMEGISLVWPEPFHGFSNIRFFNQYQVWTIPLLSLPVLSLIFGIRYVKAFMLLLICWWCLLFASSGKGALIATIFSLLVTFMVYKKESYKFMMVQVISAAGGLILYIIFFHLPSLFKSINSIELVSRPIVESATSARLELWSKALDMAIQNPIFGVGPMHYAWHPNHIAAHPHNSVLQIIAEWGVPIALILFFLFFYGLYFWTKSFNAKTVGGEENTQKHIVISIFCSFIAGVSYSLVSGVVVMPISQIMGATIIGLMLGVYNNRNRFIVYSACNSGVKCVEPSVTRTSYGQRLLAGLTLVILVWSVFPEIIPKLTSQEVGVEKSYRVYGPRFWQVGSIPH